MGRLSTRLIQFLKTLDPEDVDWSLYEARCALNYGKQHPTDLTVVLDALTGICERLALTWYLEHMNSFAEQRRALKVYIPAGGIPVFTHYVKADGTRMSNHQRKLVRTVLWFLAENMKQALDTDDTSE